MHACVHVKRRRCLLCQLNRARGASIFPVQGLGPGGERASWHLKPRAARASGQLGSHFRAPAVCGSLTPRRSAARLPPTLKRAPPLPPDNQPPRMHPPSPPPAPRLPAAVRLQPLQPALHSRQRAPRRKAREQRRALAVLTHHRAAVAARVAGQARRLRATQLLPLPPILLQRAQVRLRPAVGLLLAGLAQRGRRGRLRLLLAPAAAAGPCAAAAAGGGKGAGAGAGGLLLDGLPAAEALGGLLEEAGQALLALGSGGLEGRAGRWALRQERRQLQ
jgi:hypothetical protein